MFMLMQYAVLWLSGLHISGSIYSHKSSLTNRYIVLRNNRPPEGLEAAPPVVWMYALSPAPSAMALSYSAGLMLMPRANRLRAFVMVGARGYCTE